MNTLFETLESTELPLIANSAGKKHGWMPILTILFLLSYGLMTMLIVEQGRTIESQRALIHELFSDSMQLSAVKLAQRQQATHGAPSIAPHKIAPQIPSTQAPAKKAPSSQAGSQYATENRAAQQKRLRIPAKPASEVGDNSRVLVTI